MFTADSAFTFPVTVSPVVSSAINDEPFKFISPTVPEAEVADTPAPKCVVSAYLLKLLPPEPNLSSPERDKAFRFTLFTSKAR